MKNTLLIFSFLYLYSCTKDITENPENISAIIQESQYWIFYSRDGYLDSAVSKNQRDKVLFFYKGQFIDSIVELTIHAKNLSVTPFKDTFIYLPKIFRKYIYQNNRIFKEKIDLGFYDYYHDTSYYIKSRDLSYQFNIDSSYTITDLLSNYKTYIYLKNNNVIKLNNAQGTRTFQFDNRKNPFTNFIGLNKIYTYNTFSEICEVSSANNVINMIWENDTFNYTIDYNSTKNPIKFNNVKRNFKESFIYK